MINIKTSDHPYTPMTYHRIDNLARAELKVKEKHLKDLGMSIKMAPEIEFTITQTPEDKNHLDLLAVLQKSFKRKGTVKGFKYLKDRIYEERIPNILEVTAKRTNPSKFVDTFKTYVKHIANVAQRAGFGVSFFDQGLCKVYPTVHTNFSLWDGDKNLFAKESGYDSMKYRPLMCYIMNRLMKDLNKAVFLFSSGSVSYKSLDANNVTDRYIAWDNIEQSAKNAVSMILYRNADNSKRARGEFRFSEPSGVESAKALFFVNSICNSLDTLIKHYSKEIKSKHSNQTVAEVLERCLQGETKDTAIKRLARKPIASAYNAQYEIGSAFQPNGDKPPSALPRFKNSTRMQDLMGEDLHKLLCTTVA